jgi:DNA primase
MVTSVAWDEFKEQVRRATDIVALVGRYVQLKRSGKTFSARCPFHAEKDPSFHVYPDRQYWRCFGACNEGGDVFNFLMKVEGVEFMEALSRLADAAGIRAPERGTDAAQAQLARKEKEEFYRLHAEAAEYFRQVYLGPAGQVARSYAEKRGITGELASDFNLGFAPAAFSGLCDQFRGRKVDESALVRAGLASERESGGVYDRFRHRLMFPIRDDQGRTVGFGGRLLDGDGPKYLNSPGHRFFEKGRLLYGLDRSKTAIREAGAAVVTEGYIDVVAAHQCGLTNVVATLGTALTPEHLNLLRRFADRVVLCFDGDAAGLAAGEKGAAQCLEAGVPARVAVLPPGQDVADLCMAGQADDCRRRIEAAVESFQFLLDRMASGFDLNDPQGKAAAARSIMERIARIKDEVARGEYRRRAADRLDVSEKALEAILKELGGGKTAPAAAAPDAPLSPLMRAERDLIEFLVADGSYFDRAMASEIAGKPFRECISDVAVKDALNALADVRQQNPADSSAAADLAAELLARLDAGPAKSLVIEAIERGQRGYKTSLDDRFEKAMAGLMRLYAKEELGRLDEELRRAGREGRAADEQALKQRHAELSKSMREKVRVK